MTIKPAYERPALTKVGSLEAVTQSVNGTSKLDATFPAQTPFSQLTFS